MKSRIILCTIFAVVLMKSPSASANRFEIEEMIRRMRLENENLLNNFDSATEIDKDEDEVEIPEDYDEDVPLPESQNSQQVKQSPAMNIIPDEILILMRGYDTKLNTMITSIDSMQRHNNDKIDQLVTINTNLIAFVNETLQFDSAQTHFAMAKSITWWQTEIERLSQHRSLDSRKVDQFYSLLQDDMKNMRKELREELGGCKCPTEVAVEVEIGKADLLLSSASRRSNPEDQTARTTSGGGDVLGSSCKIPLMIISGIIIFLC